MGILQAGGRRTAYYSVSGGGKEFFHLKGGGGGSVPAKHDGTKRKTACDALRKQKGEGKAGHAGIGGNGKRGKKKYLVNLLVRGGEKNQNSQRQYAARPMQKKNHPHPTSRKREKKKEV